MAQEQSDVRWKQRLANYSKALGQLRDAVALAQSRPLTRLEQQGLIQGFQITFELAWNLLKDYFYWQGVPDIAGSRDAVRAAFKHGLLADGEAWMEMIASRNQTAHAYNEAVAQRIAGKVQAEYLPCLTALEQLMQARASAE